MDVYSCARVCVCARACVSELLSKLLARTEEKVLIWQLDRQLMSSCVCACVYMCMCFHMFLGVWIFSLHRDLDDCITVTILRHMTVSTKKTLITSSQYTHTLSKSHYTIPHSNISPPCVSKLVTVISRLLWRVDAYVSALWLKLWLFVSQSFVDLRI